MMFFWAVSSDLAIRITINIDCRGLIYQAHILIIIGSDQFSPGNKVTD